jgi:hypothetical protein
VLTRSREIDTLPMRSSTTLRTQNHPHGAKRCAIQRGVERGLVRHGPEPPPLDADLQRMGGLADGEDGAIAIGGQEHPA